jgi:hypothetical protein
MIINKKFAVNWNLIKYLEEFLRWTVTFGKSDVYCLKSASFNQTKK